MNLSALLNYYNSEKSRLDTQSMEINLFVVQSLHFIVTQFFLREANFLVITTSCRNAYTISFYKLVTTHLLRNAENMAVQLVLIENAQAEYMPGPRHHNLYLVDSLQAFLDADPVKYSANYNTNEYYYIFLQQRDKYLPQEMQGILEYCWRHYLINCNVQIQNVRGEILVYTYFPFTEQHCGRVLPVLINAFVGARMLHATIFPKKLLNLHRCQLRVATWHIPPFVELHHSSKGGLIIGGFEGRLLLELEKRLNFSIEPVKLLNSSETHSSEPLIIGDYIEAALSKLQDRTADLALGYLRENSERNRLVTSLFAHYQATQVLSVLGKTQAYSSLEILGFPFHSSTWYIVLLTLLCGLIGLRMRRTNDNTAMLGFVAIAIGVPTAQLPSRHSRRILVTHWTLGSFILRSIYTALLYDLFCTNLYRQPPSTIADLVDDNYTIVLNKDVYLGISGIAQFHEERLQLQIIDSIEEAASFVYLEGNVQRRLAAMGAMEVLLYYGRESNKSGLFYILPQAVMRQPLTIYLTKHSFLTDQLNEYLQRIQAVGLMEYWRRSELDVRFFRSLPDENRKYIGQSELNGIYCICTGLVGVALVVFGLELCAKRAAYLISALVT